LFGSLPESVAVNESRAGAEGAPRVLMAERNQIELRAMDLEATISLDHPARNVWAFVERLDLSALYGAIGSVEGRAGRAAIDPKILLALWL
jgi:transposase